MGKGKSVHVVHVLHSFGTGGMEKGIVTLVNHGTPEFRHTIVCLTKSGASCSLLQRPVDIIEMNKKEGNSLFFIFRLMKVLRRLKPDIVHTRNWGGMDGIIAAGLAGVGRVVHGEHGWNMDDPDGLNRKRVWIRRLMNPWVSKYTCVSRQMKTWLERDIKVQKKVIQIYNGVNDTLFRPGKNKSLKNSLGISSSTVVLGIVARLDPIKNHAGLFKAFDLVHSFLPDSCLLVVGDGPERNRLEKISCDGVLFLGNRSDVWALMGCMDIFVLPSFNEGISNTILEAMAAGLPVIASDRGGNPELVKDNLNGFLFEPENTSNLGNLILNYIRDPELKRRHGRYGRKMIETRFSIDRMVRAYENVWMECYM